MQRKGYVYIIGNIHCFKPGFSNLINIKLYPGLEMAIKVFFFLKVLLLASLLYYQSCIKKIECNLLRKTTLVLTVNPK